MKIQVKKDENQTVIGDKIPDSVIIQRLEYDKEVLLKELDTYNLINNELSDRLEYLTKELEKMANSKEINQENLTKDIGESWCWNKFVIGLSRFGITEGIIISSFLLVLTQLIQYLELLSIPENQSGYLVLSGFLITILKSIQQILKENTKNV